MAGCELASLCCMYLAGRMYVSTCSSVLTFQTLMQFFLVVMEKHMDVQSKEEHFSTVFAQVGALVGGWG